MNEPLQNAAPMHDDAPIKAKTRADAIAALGLAPESPDDPYAVSTVELLARVEFLDRVQAMREHRASPPPATSHVEAGHGDAFQASVIEQLSEIAAGVARIEKLRAGYEEHDETVVKCEGCDRLTARVGATFFEEDGVYVCPACEPPPVRVAHDFDALGVELRDRILEGPFPIERTCTRFLIDKFGGAR